MRKRFIVKLLVRILIAVIALGLYIFLPEQIDYTHPFKSFFLCVLWVILMADLILRFIPGKYHHPGMQKHLKRNFCPTDAYLQVMKSNKGMTEEMRFEKKQRNKDALCVLTAFLILNAVIYTLFFTGILRVQELFLLFMVYYVGDTICSVFFCPFRIFFMRNRCCTVCRIYSWDSAMLFFPILPVPCLFSVTLGVVAFLHTAYWEISYYMHPEYFLETCNQNLTCRTCQKVLCPIIKRKK